MGDSSLDHVQDLESQVNRLNAELSETRATLETEIAKRMKNEATHPLGDPMYRSPMEDVDFSIALMDKNFNIIQSCTNLTAFGKYSSETTKQKCYYACANRQSPCPACLGNRAMATGRVQTWEESIEFQGRQTILRKRAIPLAAHKGSSKGFIEVVENISEAVATRQALHAATEAAEAINISKNQFLANMSHEIRTPLNGVIGVFNLLLATAPDNEQISLIQTGKRSADNLLTIINDILDFSKTEAEKLNLETIDFDLRDTIEETMELPAIRAHEQGIAFTYEIDSAVPSLLKGDPGRLRQILLNLCNNALKFTKQGEVSAHISLIQNSGNQSVICFEISDTGIGIAEDKQEVIFEAFKQTDASTTRLYGGTGLGLSICKRLTELMGGRISVTSQLGQGASFKAVIPFERQVNVQEIVWMAPPDIQGKRFLLVDDNPTNLKILSSYIDMWGCLCDTAHSGEMALSLLNALAKVGASFDAAIIDMLMPSMDGIGLGKAIKSNPNFAHIPLIMLTSMGLRGDASKVKEIGFSAYLTKPIKQTQLYSCITNVLGKTQWQRSDNSPEPPIVTRYTITADAKKRSRILIVEDNAINRKIAVQMIENFGFQTEVACNGREALAAVARGRFDAVLMDVQMPEMDGFEATRHIRRQEAGESRTNTPIIAMTAHAMEGDRQRCLEVGMNDYISKPVQPQELLDTIMKYL